MKKKTLVLPFLTVCTAVLALLAIVVFTLASQKNISRSNREYLVDNTDKMAALVDDSLMHGLVNIQVLSSLTGELLTSPQIDVATLQRVLDDSIFDFIEFTDRDGKNHNTTGGISEAGDRRYFQDAMQGNSGVELIFNSRATRETLLVFYAPVYFKGEVIGSLLGAYREASQLTELLTMDVFDCRAEAYLCSEDGLIIASNQEIDTTAGVPIETVLAARVPARLSSDDLVYRGEPLVIPLQGNETGACVMKLKNSDWYIIQIFPEQANRLMTVNANRLGILLAAFLVAILAGLLVLTYLILNRSRLETQKALVEAEAASKAKTDFLFSMSHDLHTPMNAIIGFLRLLDEQQEDPAKRKEYIGKIESSSRLLHSIIDNVLKMSKIEEGGAALEETVCSAEEILACAGRLAGADMRQKQIRFETTLEVEHPYIFCDLEKLEDIYRNILTNACQYTQPGGRVSMRLAELCSNRPGYALYQTEIEDSGIGIAKEFLPHIFETFSREQDTTHSKVAGTGLGMAIVKQLCERMGGTVTVESEWGKGTRVTVRIPHRIAEGTQPGQPGPDGEPPAKFLGKRILLAEDNDLNAEIAAELFGEMGFETDRAQDGGVCVSMLKEAPAGYYDLVVMDVQMPNTNGYEAAQAIRRLNDPAKVGIPIVAMTANAFEEDKQNAYSAGMNAHLEKPVDVKKIRQTLDALL